MNIEKYLYYSNLNQSFSFPSVSFSFVKILSTAFCIELERKRYMRGSLSGDQNPFLRRFGSIRCLKCTFQTSREHSHLPISMLQHPASSLLLTPLGLKLIHRLANKNNTGGETLFTPGLQWPLIPDCKLGSSGNLQFWLK